MGGVAADDDGSLWDRLSCPIALTVFSVHTEGITFVVVVDGTVMMVGKSSNTSFS
jgi:hypothetical protein